MFKILEYIEDEKRIIIELIEEVVCDKKFDINLHTANEGLQFREEFKIIIMKKILKHYAGVLTKEGAVYITALAERYNKLQKYFIKCYSIQKEIETGDFFIIEKGDNENE